MQLVIGNKNYSSWSMRPWVLLRQFGLPFDEVMARFDGFDADSAFKKQVGMLVWLKTSFFAFFFAVYIAVTLALNLAWHLGWRGIALPQVFTDIDEID